MSKTLPRRTVLKAALMGGAALPLMAKLTDAEAAALPLVDANDATAKALGYVADAAKVDAKKFGTYKAGQNCANCLQFKGKATDKQGPCGIFPKNEVAAAGWCSVWTKKA